MKIRAFVFDDDERVRSVLTAILKERGYEVYEFSEPRFCPLLLENSCPCPEGHTCGDIVISDLNMPTMSGLTFIENQRRHGCNVKHFALLSGAYSDEELRKAKKLGCQIFEKPIKMATLAAWLDQCERGIDPNRELWDWFKH